MSHTEEPPSSNQSTTHDAILTAALALFSQKGFEGTSMRDIAAMVGITQGAIYKHFKGKDDVLAAICRRMEESDGEHAKGSDVPHDNPAPMDTHTPCSPAAFRSFTLDMFAYWACDPMAAPFRRMLEIDRFRTPHMQKLHAQYLGSGPLEYTSDCLMSMGTGKTDAHRHATILWGAFRMLLELVDSQAMTVKAALEELTQLVDDILA